MGLHRLVWAVSRCDRCETMLYGDTSDLDTRGEPWPQGKAGQWLWMVIRESEDCGEGQE